MAELSGFTWASLFALQYKCKECRLCYDSKYAAHSADATWRSAMGTPFAAVATAVYHLLTVVTLSTVTTYEPGHHDLPFNAMCISSLRD